MMGRVWNVVAALAVVVILVYVGLCGGALVMGKATFNEFQQSILPVITAVVGYLAAFLPKRE